MCGGGWWRVCRRQRPPTTAHCSKDADQRTARGFQALLMESPLMNVLLMMVVMLVLCPMEVMVSRVIRFPLADLPFPPMFIAAPFTVPGMSMVLVANWRTVLASRHHTTCGWRKEERMREDASGCEQVPMLAMLMSISPDPWRRKFVQSPWILPEGGCAESRLHPHRHLDLLRSPMTPSLLNGAIP